MIRLVFVVVSNVYSVLCLYLHKDTCCVCSVIFFFFQAEDGIRDLVRSRGLGDVYKRQVISATNIS